MDLKLCYCDVEGGSVPEEDCHECVLLSRQGLQPDEYMKCRFYGKITPREELRQVIEND